MFGMKHVERLEKEKKALLEEIEELKLKKRMDEREIKQLVKIKLDNAKLEQEQKTMELEREFKDKESELMKRYHEDRMKDIDKARNEIQEVYSQIMERLPNVNMKIKREE